VPIDTLMTAAEIAVGIAGFAAIVVALGRLDVDSERGRIGLFVLFSVPFGALIFSLLPVVLVYLNMGESATLRISSVLMAVFVLSWYAFIYSQPQVYETRSKRWLYRGVAVIAAANILAQIANAVVLSDRWHFGIYFAGVVWLQISSVAGLLWGIEVRGGD
jgi:hypothetical protein